MKNIFLGLYIILQDKLLYEFLVQIMETLTINRVAA